MRRREFTDGRAPAHDCRLFRYHGQVRASSGVWPAAALLPLLQRALADAIGSCKLGLRHSYTSVNRFHVDGLPQQKHPDGFPAYARDQLTFDGFCAISRTVQRARPSGGLLHTMAIKRLLLAIVEYPCS